MIPAEYNGDQEERNAWRRRTLLRMIADAAAEGRPCPSNAEITEAVSFQAPSSASLLLRRLHNDGRIEITGKGKERTVRIRVTGATTASPSVSRARSAIDAAAAVWAVPTHKLMGPERAKMYIRPRFAAALVASEMGASAARIGRFLARDHSTILHSIAQARDWERRYPDFAEGVANIRKRVFAA